MTNLVHIRSRKERPQEPLFKKLIAGPLVDKFFALGVIAAIGGMGYLGLHMWLALHGNARVWTNFAEMKYLHIDLQFYGFFCCFIFGFLLQALPKLVEVKRPVARWTLVVPLFLILGIGIRNLSVASAWGGAFLSAAVLLVAIEAAQFVRQAEASIRLGIGVPLGIGLLTFGFAPYIDLGAPGIALLVFWGSIAAVVFAAGQQFIKGFIGGEKLSWNGAIVFCLLFILSLLSLSRAVFLPAESMPYWILAAFLCFATALSFLFFTQAWRSLFRAKDDFVALAFVFGFAWLIYGAILLAAGPLRADFVLHAWALGWGVALIFAVSIRIVRHLSGLNIMPDWFLRVLLISWQLVPLGRATVLHTISGSSWVTAYVSGLVVLAWGLPLLYGITRIWLRQVQAPNQAEVLQC